MENCIDICTQVGKFLSNHDKIQFSMCSIKLDRLKYIYHYENKIGIKYILYLPYYNNFTNVFVNKKFEKICYGNKLPSSITHLSFSNHYSSISYINIPSSVTHLTISNNFIFPINNRIPSTVTHLIFGKYFDRHIEYEYPSRITHLTFGEEFNLLITDMIPLSVTHLTFNGTLIEPDIDIIPLTITHLSLRADCFFPTKTTR